MPLDTQNCLLCESEAVSYQDFYWKCPTCGLVFKSPETFPEYMEEKQRYLTHNNDVNDLGYLNYLSKAFDLADVKKGRFLDYGCGPTQGLNVLVEHKKFESIQVDSYDPIFFPMDFSKKQPSRAYDLVFASESFEHFYKPQKEISKIVDLLKVGGCLVVSTGFYEEQDLKAWWYAKDPTHVVFYSKQTFEWVSSKYDLKIKYLKSPYVIFVKT